MSYRPRTTSANQRAQMRSCLYSACETAKDLSPVYLCNVPRKQAIKQQVCVFHDHSTSSDKIMAFCRQYEVFPERFDT
jgi:hypothetical protein